MDAQARTAFNAPHRALSPVHRHLPLFRAHQLTRRPHPRVGAASAAPPRRRAQVVTLWYRAPEILLGLRTYSWSVDIWSVACLLVEMLNGKPLFPGDSEIDQIMRIFRGLGTPDADRWPSIAALPEWKGCYPKWRAQPWAQLVPALADDPSGQDLLARMLWYDPDERIAAFDALAHPFFDGLDKELFHAATRR